MYVCMYVCMYVSISYSGVLVIYGSYSCEAEGRGVIYREYTECFLFQFFFHQSSLYPINIFAKCFIRLQRHFISWVCIAMWIAFQKLVSKTKMNRESGFIHI